MFHLEKDECSFSTTDQLLYNIWQELKELKTLLNKQDGLENTVLQALEDINITATEESTEADKKHGTDREEEKKLIPCKACGGTHETKGAMLACCRKAAKNQKK
jgi:hypothetical protein